MFNNIKSAFYSIWNNKITSLLTIMGVVIGVTSVIVLISLGQGLKNDVSSIIEGLGSNVLAVIGGKMDAENMQNNNQMNPAQFIASDILTISDVDKIKNISEVKEVIPMSMVASNIKYRNKTATPTIIGMTANFSKTISLLKLKEGSLFNDNTKERSIIIPETIETTLFNGEKAINKKVMIGNSEFTVIGVFEKPTDSILGSEYSSMSVIPFDTATMLNKDQVKIYRIIIKGADKADVKKIQASVKDTILQNHNGEENFSVLTQDDLLGLIDQFLSLATSMVTAIAAISLVVGGIGIMNIMLITVTERTKEIGLRKAVGASKKAILIQFLVEAIVITLIGGMLGLATSFAIIKVVEYRTTLTPAITSGVIIMSLGLSTLVGIIFGLWPALRAASKDPIEALRRE